jgi:hypothetical protein
VLAGNQSPRTSGAAALRGIRRDGTVASNVLKYCA